MRPLVEALMCLKGVNFVTAVTFVAEIGDLTRFAHPRALMSYLGLVPSEYSSGASREACARLTPSNQRYCPVAPTRPSNPIVAA